MKIIKHEVKTYIFDALVSTDYFETKEKALKRALDNYPSDVPVMRREYTGEVEIDLYCESCDKELTPGDTYIKKDECTRYCDGCYDERRVTYYTVSGEHVGDEDDVEKYSERDKEGEEV